MCAVLGFGVLSVIMSSKTNQVIEPQIELPGVLSPAGDELAVTEVVAEEKPQRPVAPKLDEQARRARDRRAEEREKRSAQALDEERPETDVITIRQKD